ncbi:MAG: TonB-dependent receptor [Bacteroidota bacterium]|nr:TonB-dependent receptor [Bacteroidota bacterium]
MLRKVGLVLVLLVFSVCVFAQTGTLKGVLIDAVSGEAIPFANVVAFKSGNQVAGTTTDFDGNYTIKPLDPGNYDLKSTFVGYQTVEVTGIIVSANKITYQDVKLQKGVALGEVKIIEYKKPLLDKDNLAGQTKTAEEIVALPTKSVSTIAATSAGIFQRDEGDGSLNIRGSRDNATEYYIDGIKVRGAISPPSSSIEQITVITGGLEAKYGDATGGIISIATKGPAAKFSGGFEVVSSSLFDDYNYNLGQVYLTGPIIKKTLSDGAKRTLLGYFVSTEFTMEDDTDPSAIGMWKVKDNVLDQLRAEPFVYNENEGFKSSSNFLTPNDYENVQAKQNTARHILNASGKLIFQPVTNTTLTLGGSYYDRKRNDFSDYYSMFASDQNRNSTQKTYRLFGTLTQKFGSEESNSDNSSSTVKNAYFTVSADYTNNKYAWGDKNYTDDTEWNLFNVGYVGKFETFRTKLYSSGDFLDSNTGIWYNSVNILTTYSDTFMRFTPNGASNPHLVNYTQAYYDIFQDKDVTLPGGTPGVIRNRYELQGFGLSNGERPASVYSLFANHGTWYPYAFKEENTQLAFKATGSADIKNHEISFGIEYEQRKDYYWQANLYRNLWLLGDLLTNSHIEEFDLANPIFDTLPNGIFTGVVDYNRLYQGEAQSTFDKSLRQALGLPIDGLDYLDINSISPELLKLSYFGEDELLNNGNEYVYYYGYDIYGNKTKDSQNGSLADFFATEGSKRYIQPFAPILQSAYIQDKFAIDDLILKVGVRFERYDANQKVLKDRYLLFSAHTAGHQNSVGDFWDGLTDYTDSQGRNTHPSTIGNDYVVYVNQPSNPTAVVGYRDGDTWYNAVGNEISDPSVLEDLSEGKITPYLIKPNDAASNIISMDAFKDYEPELIIMPRVGFSFPISDEAQFHAHYDVLTQRPQSNSRLDPIQYLYLRDVVNPVLNNPDLKPEKTVDYEVGFSKKLNLKSSLVISAFYKEMRDMITRINTIGAYPQKYITYGNEDFGTVKGLTLKYDLRRTNNIQMYASYTLQFTDGTGSSASTGEDIVGSGYPNLRSTSPLEYDQRHAISATVDYHYARGKNYNGPILFGKKILQDAGMNIVITAGSGTPYSRQSNITAEALSGINDRKILDGSLNGSRLPWSFRMSAKVDKDFKINDKSTLNFYIQVNNLLDAQNIISVYRKTGNPEDDGYLALVAATESDPYDNKESFMYLYGLDVNNPGNYSRPRMWRAGVSMNF